MEDSISRIRDRIKMYSVEERDNQFDVDQFVTVPKLDSRAINSLIESLPGILAGKDFRELVHSISYAYRQSRSVIVFIGGHVIKCGLAPLFIEMMKRKVITHTAMNGAAAIHDVEIAMMGHTSEWVKDLLPEGKWGMWKETGKVIHEAIAGAYQSILLDDIQHSGMGYGLSCAAWRLNSEYDKYSILAQMWYQSEPMSESVPLTVHVSIGCDVIHQHPQANFEHIGATSGRDFYKLVEAISGLNDGGVFINFGSSAVGPEVFSKALNLARNTGNTVKNFTTANFDVVELPERLSRSKKNVITRPHIGSEYGKGYAITGHHEIMIPLLFQAVMADIWGEKD